MFEILGIRLLKFHVGKIKEDVRDFFFLRTMCDSRTVEATNMIINIFQVLGQI